MKTDSVVLQNWDDLVFENRNKEYGAYCTRKAYSENVNIGFAICLMAGAGLFAAYHLNSLLSSKIAIPHLKKGDSGIPLPPPKIIPAIEKTTPISKIKSVNQNLAVQVVTKPVETVIPTNNQIEIDTDPGLPVEEGTIPATGSNLVGEPPAITEPTIFLTAEVMPSYDGGVEAMMRFIGRKIRYPNSARQMGIEGTTFVQFVIDANGKVTDVNVIRGFNAACDAEAARVISLMKDWKAGMQNHSPVAVRMVLPIKFKIDQN